MNDAIASSHIGRRLSLKQRLVKDFMKYKGAYLLVLPVLAYYIIFAYKPMFGALIAFEDFSPRKGIFGSEWLGLVHFESFFSSYYIARLIRNTLVISITGLVIGFPLPIIFALLLNEVQNNKFKRTVQTISYMPHFISLVVVCAMVKLFTSGTGFISQIARVFGFEGNHNLLNVDSAFVPIYVLSGVWQNIGWNCIIYLAALSSIDSELYEAARIDGASRWKQTVHVTLPGIVGTVILLLILRIGSIMGVGHEKIILLYNDFVMERADVISSYVYRRGLVNSDWSFSSAVGLFNSVINFTLVICANRLSNKIIGMGIW